MARTSGTPLNIQEDLGEEGRRQETVHQEELSGEMMIFFRLAAIVGELLQQPEVNVTMNIYDQIRYMRDATAQSNLICKYNLLCLFFRQAHRLPCA